MDEKDDRVAGWLRDVELAPGAERQDAIDAAAHSVAGDLGGRDVLDLVCLAFGDSRSAIANRVADAVHAEDATAALRSDDKETALTAAIATVRGMEAAPDPGVSLALGVLGATFVGMTPSIAELEALARRALVVLSEDLRHRTKLPTASTDLKAVIAEAGDYSSENEAIYTQHVRAALAATEKATKRALNAVNQLVVPLNRRLSAADEELDLLWWCFGEYSEIADKPFKSVPVGAAPLVLGAEFARHIKSAAPLPSTRAILSRALGTRAANVTTLSKSVPAAMKLAEVGDFPATEGHSLPPVLSSAGEYRELGGKAAWTGSVERWAIDVTREASALDLAEQVVREILLARQTS